ncbi:MAG TPA: histidine kinase [Runella sp.]|nr:histidine kinase [Runella sp.]
MHTPIDNHNLLTNPVKRLLISSLAFLLLYLVAYLLEPQAIYWKQYFQRPPLSILAEWAVSFAFCYTISVISSFINRQLNAYLPWTVSPGKRLAVETVLNLVINLAINFLICLSLVYFSRNASCLESDNVATDEDTRIMIQWYVVSALISVMIMGINTGNFLITNWKNEALRATELKQVAAEAELQAMKLQIDPHFVFNNLSVLSELILADQQLGYEYAENFSKIYRYLLVNAKKDIISLEEELKFLQAYIFLIQHRFGDGIQFDIKVQDDCRTLFMPPLTLQLLVENALKHNRTSRKAPLTIRIYTNDLSELIVENNRLPIEKPIHSSGIGLKNIRSRYGLLSERHPQLISDETIFKVILPLLKR